MTSSYNYVTQTVPGAPGNACKNGARCSSTIKYRLNERLTILFHQRRHGDGMCLSGLTELTRNVPGRVMNVFFYNGRRRDDQGCSDGLI